jgi:hypothetical protein
LVKVSVLRPINRRALTNRPFRWSDNEARGSKASLSSFWRDSSVLTRQLRRVCLPPLPALRPRWSWRLGPSSACQSFRSKDQLLPTATSYVSRSSRSVDAWEVLDAAGRIYTTCTSAGGRAVAGSNPVAPITSKLDPFKDEIHRLLREDPKLPGVRVPHGPLRPVRPRVTTTTRGLDSRICGWFGARARPSHARRRGCRAAASRPARASPSTMPIAIAGATGPIRTGIASSQ